MLLGRCGTNRSRNLSGSCNRLMRSQILCHAGEGDVTGLQTAVPLSSSAGFGSETDLLSEGSEESEEEAVRERR